MGLIKEVFFDVIEKRWKDIFSDGVDNFTTMKRLYYNQGNIEFNQHKNSDEFFKYQFFNDSSHFLKAYGIEYIIEGNLLVEKSTEIFNINHDLVATITNGVEFLNIDSYTQLFSFFFREYGDAFRLNLKPCNDFIKAYFLEHHSWIRFYLEMNIGEEFNQIILNKLFSHKKYWGYKYRGIPYKEYEENTLKFGILLYNIEHFYNQQNINTPLFSRYDPEFETILFKAIEISKITNKKINCAWSLRRLNEFIDKHSFFLINTYTKYINHTFEIQPIFIKFAEFSGLIPVKTFKEIATLGLIKRNCIGGLGDSIESGDRCLFVIGGNVLDVIIRTNNGYYDIEFSQMRSKFNFEASLEDRTKQLDFIRDFNNSFSIEEKKLLFPAKKSKSELSVDEEVFSVADNEPTEGLNNYEDTTDYWLSETISYFNEELNKEQRQDYINKLIKLNEE